MQEAELTATGTSTTEEAEPKTFQHDQRQIQTETGSGPVSAAGSKQSSIVDGSNSKQTDTKNNVVDVNERKETSKYKKVSSTHKLGFLIWKNFQILKRHKLQTFLEILLPVLFISIVLVVRVLIKTAFVKEKIWGLSYFYGPTRIQDTYLDAKPIYLNLNRTFLYFSPDTSQATQIMEIVRRHYLAYGMANGMQIKGFSTEAKLEDAYSKSRGNVLGGIVFERISQTTTQYKIRLSSVQKHVNSKTLIIFEVPRWHTDSVYPNPQLRGIRQPYQIAGGTPGYSHQGFTYLQFAVDASIIKFFSPNTDIGIDTVDKFIVKMAKFSYPSSADDRYLVIFISVFQIVIVLSFLYPVNNIVKHIVVEKEKRLVESMKLMGIGPAFHWLAWLVNHFFFLVLTNVLMVFLLQLKVQKKSVVIFNADASVLFVFLLAYISSIITFGFFLSTLFSKANAAVMTSWILFSLTYLPFIFLSSQYEKMGLVAKMLAMLFLNTAMAYGFQIILIQDGFGPYGEGSHWGNINSSAGANDTLSLLHVIVMLFVDSVIYMLLAIYIEAVFPGEFGIPRRWYFLVQKSYWCRPKNNKMEDRISDNTFKDTLKEINYDENPQFEKPPDSLKAGIKIRDLTKTFGTKTVVNNLNIDIFENQITVLLGHNGAGKTTTMSMLTGLFPPTSGTAVINNVDIRKNIDHIQGNLRLCPQHDILFDELTCEQHLKLYCWVKGCVDVKGEVDGMLSALNLEPKRHTEARSLSGGMKRKLSVGMALIGGSPTVIFDEPTAGMDPAARRIVWDLLASEKKKRTIILSTHFMDEADLLGDRIAVLAGGQLQAVGSSLFLKKLYGDGYQLVIVKQQGCDVSKISDLLRRHLDGNVEIANNVGAELCYTLPKEKSPLFSNLFDELEERREELLIDSYGATVTTMEEVFMRITKGVATSASKPLVPSTQADSTKPSSESGSTAGVFISYKQVKPILKDVFTTHYNCSTGFALDWQQFRACLVKKWLYVSRSWALIIIQVVIPVALVLGMYIAMKTSSSAEQSIKLNLEKFKNTITPMLCRKSDSLCDAYQNYALKFTTVIPAKMSLPQYNMSEYILAESKKSLSKINSQYIIGFEQKVDFNVSKYINLTLYVAHYNNQPYHAQPVTLNFLMNAILRVITGDDKKEIIIYNHPLPISAHDKALDTKSTEILIFILGMIIMFGISFVVASFVIFLIRERAGKAKHLQRVSGLKMTVYWLANFAFDSTTYLVTVAFILIVIVSFSLDPYSERYVYLGIFLLLVAYGWAAIPIVYVSSFVIGSPAAGFTKLAVVSIFLGIGPYVTMVIVNIPEFESHELAETLGSIFMFLPIFSMGYGIYELGFNRNLHLECPALFVVIPKTAFCAPNNQNINKPHLCCVYDVPYFAWHPFGIGQNLVTLFVTGLVAIFTLILIEAKVFQKIQDSRERAKAETLKLNASASDKTIEDDDVRAETNRIQTSNKEKLFQSENLVLHNLTKYFGPFKAVDSLNLGVQKGECFGLLGVNGAGKTTTFRILTGDLSASSGDAFVVGHSVRKDLKYIHKKVGYCPQFDALIDELTGRETIRLFARLRGISEKEINNLANRLGDVLVFSEFLDKPAGTYSGGNQRKLSTAIALVGNPPLVFLDEPSTGMDPVARRHLWDCLSKVRESGASIILTSHSMEECEALCTRLVIMVSGHFRCLGSIQHLKSKFSEGFTVTAQLQTQTASSEQSNDLTLTQVKIPARRSSKPSDYENIPLAWETEIKALEQFIETSFPDSVLKDAHVGYVHYQVGNPSLTWGYLFRKMEEAKTIFALEAYSVGQTSMDQIFLLFGKNQDSDE